MAHDAIELWFTHTVYIDVRVEAEILRRPSARQDDSVLVTAARTDWVATSLNALWILSLHFGADFFGGFHYAQGVFAEDFADVGVGVTLSHQGFGDYG